MSNLDAIRAEIDEIEKAHGCGTLPTNCELRRVCAVLSRMADEVEALKRRMKRENRVAIEYLSRGKLP